MVSASLVNVSEDAELRFINSLGVDDAFQEKCSTLLTNGDIGDLLATILTSSSTIQSLMDIETTTELISVVSLLVSMIQKLETPSERQAVTVQFVDIVCSGPTDELSAIERRIAVISVLYNMLEIHQKCMLLHRMFQLAGSHSDVLLQPEATLGRLISSSMNDAASFSTGVVMNPLPPIATLLNSWGEHVSVTERRALFSCICTILRKDDRRKQLFLLLLVETYSDAASVDDAAISVAKEVAIGAIRDPVSLFRFQRDLLAQPAIQALQHHDSDLYDFLKIFQEGTMSNYEAFVSSHGGGDAFLSKWGLNPTSCTRFLRILSLCSLATGRESISYSEISQSLHLSESDQVESWVIAAVSSGLLQAKMDQLSQVVTVERCVVRKFDVEQWKSLQRKLTAWKDHVGDILAALKQQKDTPLSSANS
jgi:translation initiation factor 3 subunit M